MINSGRISNSFTYIGEYIHIHIHTFRHVYLYIGIYIYLCINICIYGDIHVHFFVIGCVSINNANIYCRAIFVIGILLYYSLIRIIAFLLLITKTHIYFSKYNTYQSSICIFFAIQPLKQSQFPYEINF